MTIGRFGRAGVLAAALMAMTATGAAAQQPAEARLDAAARRAVVDSIGRVLARWYVDEAKGRALGERLSARLASGAFDSLDTGDALARALTREMIGEDRHLWLTYTPEREFTMQPGPRGGGAAPRPSGSGGVVRTGRIDGRDSAEIARTNFAFRRVERLAGNVGYLRLDQFVPLDLSRETAAAAMAFLAGSDAVIVDLRGNPGGAPDVADFLLSYFLGPEPVKVAASYNRALNETRERFTLRELPGRRLAGVDLWVLTGPESASMAESFATIVKQQKIGTVVGETTSGAGHGGARLSVGNGISMFVPQWLPLLGGWERTGVAPDVPVPADSALAVAHRMALRRLVAKADDERLRREREWALALVAAPPRADAEALERYAGTYGTRTIAVEGGALVLRSERGRPQPLIPVGAGVFQLGESARYRFEPGALVVELPNGRTTRAERTGA